MTLHELATITDIGSVEKVRQELNILKQEYASRESPITVSELEDGRFKLGLHTEYLKKVRTLAPHMDMKRAIVRILSHIALKQVVTQSELVLKFGNRVYDYIKDLEKRGLIRTEPYRRTKKIITTKKLYALLGEEDATSVKGQLETAKEELEQEVQRRIAELKPTYKTRGKKKHTQLPDKDLTPEDWMSRIKKENSQKLGKQMDQFEKKIDGKKKDTLEDDYMEVFELKGGSGEEEKEDKQEEDTE